jgi:hypothetical protein
MRLLAYIVFDFCAALETVDALLQIGMTPGLICRLRSGGKMNMSAWKTSKGQENGKIKNGCGRG